MANDKQHFWLTTGHVVFQENDGGRIFRTREYNSLLKSPVQAISLKDVTKVQQTFFIRATQEVDQSMVQTVDMVVTNMSYLGYFTESEFTAGTSVNSDAVKTVAPEEPRFQ